MNILKKIPSWAQIAPVYALIVVMIYSWTLMRFFWNLPSWFYHATLDKIGILYAYMVAVNFVESLLVLATFVFAGMVLPRKYFLDRFVTLGLLLTLIGLGYLMLLDYNMQAESPFPITLFRWTPVAVLLVLVASFLLERLTLVRFLLGKLAENITIFLYIYLPISIISIIVVLFRNAF